MIKMVIVNMMMMMIMMIIMTIMQEVNTQHQGRRQKLRRVFQVSFTLSLSYDKMSDVGSGQI